MKTAILTQLQLREAILEWAIANTLLTLEEAQGAEVTVHAKIVKRERVR